MAEYIDRERVIEFVKNYPHYDFDSLVEELYELPTADVIERVEYDKLLEENKQLKRIISEEVNEDLKCAFEIKELRSKIDKVIEQIEQVKSVMNEEIIEHDRKDLINFINGVNQCLIILRKHIGE